MNAKKPQLAPTVKRPEGLPTPPPPPMGRSDVEVHPCDDCERKLREAEARNAELQSAAENLVFYPYDPDSQIEFVMVRRDTFEHFASVVNLPASDQCDHNWVDATNEVVLSGEMCSKCKSIRCSDGTILRAL